MLDQALRFLLKELAKLFQKIIAHNGVIVWDKSKPDGTPRKLMDSQKINQIGWKSLIDLERGAKMTY